MRLKIHLRESQGNTVLHKSIFFIIKKTKKTNQSGSQLFEVYKIRGLGDQTCFHSDTESSMIFKHMREFVEITARSLFGINNLLLFLLNVLTLPVDFDQWIITDCLGADVNTKLKRRISTILKELFCY